ncbi:RNA pseudouridine synthase [Treponema sp. OttesenSCG-928-L16]|nr:RNA pseudouridine synthase [Treponema sp. OttesenSCG-928-L16]
MYSPALIAETPDYLVVYKPPRMHSAPLRRDETGTLLDWVRAEFPDVLIPRGQKALEGGLLHRLDRDTHGLVLLGRTQEALDALNRQQRDGRFQKEYGALSEGGSAAGLPGFPPPPAFGPVPCFIESAFRAYGPGRRQVRPLAPAGGESGRDEAKRPVYRTEVLAMKHRGRAVFFTLRLCRGFRHQIRCHLAWTGFPLVNDSLYSGAVKPSMPMGLRAQRLSFDDPSSGEGRSYSIPSLEDEAFFR